MVAMHNSSLSETPYVIASPVSTPAALAAGQRLRRDLGTKLKHLETVQRKLARAQQHASNYMRIAERLDADIQQIRAQLAALEFHYSDLTKMVSALDLEGLSPRTLAWLERLRRSKSFGMAEMRSAAKAIEWDASDNHIRVTISLLKRKGYVLSVGRGIYQLSPKLAD